MMTKQEKRDYQRKWIAKRRYDFFSVQVCLHCSIKEDLELHHIDRTKKVSHNIWSWKLERRIEELKKCTVLCYNCHLAETKKQFEIDHSHGTTARYNKGCRCELCKAKHAEKFRRLRAMWLEKYGPNYRKIVK